MKRIFYFLSAAIYIFSFSGCGGNDQKPASNDSAKIRNTAVKNPDKKYKHLAFLDSAMRKKLEDSIEFYSAFRAKFDVVSLDKFDQYSNDFNSMFKISMPTSPIDHNLPLPFSIYEKFQGFQLGLNLQLTQFTDQTSQITYQNKIRVYPAIDASKIFYLVLMGEVQDITTQPQPAPVTNRRVYYSIKYHTPFGTTDAPFGEISTQVPPLTMTEAETDIRRFQSTLTDIATAHPGLTFNKDRSFSYSINDYDELLSNTFPYWNVAGEKTDPNSNVVIRIFPGIDQDNTTHVRFRLMLKLYRLTTRGYTEITGKAIFDNMDPCPTACPGPTTDIQ